MRRKLPVKGLRPQNGGGGGDGYSTELHLGGGWGGGGGRCSSRNLKHFPLFVSAPTLNRDVRYELPAIYRDVLSWGKFEHRHPKNFEVIEVS